MVDRDDIEAKARETVTGIDLLHELGII